MSRSGNSVIQGFFAQGMAHLAVRFSAAVVQPKRASPAGAPRPSPLAVKPTRPIQPHAAGNSSAFPLPDHLASFTQVGGQPLPAAVRQKMESFFSTSFEDVRVHVGPHAPAIGALAFTQGTHIHFAPGQYNPSSPQGQQILGHELTHVVQQRAGRVRNPFGSGVAVVQDVALEAEAERLGRRAAAQAQPAQPCVSPVRPQPTRTAVQPLKPRTPPPAPPRPVRGAVQRYKVVGRDKIFPKEPARRPWFGYPYAVVPKGTYFSGQQRAGADTEANEFLVKGNRDQAHVVDVSRRNRKLSLRVSDDGKMAIENSDFTNRQPKTFFATRRVIADANRALKNAGSILKLKVNDQTIEILTGWNTQTILAGVNPKFSQDPAQNCDEIAGQITGLGGGGNLQSDGLVSRYPLAHFLRRDPKDFDEDAEVRSYIFWQSRLPNRFNRLGLNARAEPDVGEAFQIRTLGPTESRKHNRGQVRDIASGEIRDLGWGFHFGAVVARSGRDRITLENYARGDKRCAGADPRWFFQMYGESPGQTFHEFHEAKREYANPVTFAIVRNPRKIPELGRLWYLSGDDSPSII